MRRRDRREAIANRLRHGDTHDQIVRSGLGSIRLVRAVCREYGIPTPLDARRQLLAHRREMLLRAPKPERSFRRRSPAERIEALEVANELLRSGVSRTDAAAAIGVSLPWLRTLLRNEGKLQCRPARKVPESAHLMIMARYTSGESVPSLAAEYGVSRYGIYYIINKYKRT